MEKQLSDSNSLNAASEFVHGLRHSFWVIKNKVLDTCSKMEDYLWLVLIVHIGYNCIELVSPVIVMTVNVSVVFLLKNSDL